MAACEAADWALATIAGWFATNVARSAIFSPRSFAASGETPEIAVVRPVVVRFADAVKSALNAKLAALRIALVTSAIKPAMFAAGGTAGLGAGAGFGRGAKRALNTLCNRVDMFLSMEGSLIEIERYPDKM